MLRCYPFHRSRAHPFRDNVLKANLPGANLRASYPNTTNLTNAELTNVGWRLHEMRGTISACQIYRA
jgi:uncharacterized protein YjbI with pentapeptide repeats